METGKNHSGKYTGPAGKVWLAGAGPGDAGLLTVKAAELIKSADVIVYDALISTEILSRIPPETEVIYVGKHAGNHPVPQDEINRILVREAKKGKKVLRLKGGDPFVFGRGGEELEELKNWKNWSGKAFPSRWSRASHLPWRCPPMRESRSRTGIIRLPSM